MVTSQAHSKALPLWRLWGFSSLNVIIYIGAGLFWAPHPLLPLWDYRIWIRDELAMNVDSLLRLFNYSLIV